MADVNNYFESLERALRKISIILVDDYEEIKKGMPGPTISLIRKLVFNTSTIVMKNMLLRGVASHVSDKKLVIATFDLLRETIKHSPGITVDQFLSAGFATHKMSMLQKIAEYVATVDRNIARTPQKTTIVVPNESLMRLNSPNGGLSQYSVDDLSSQLMSAAVNDSSDKSTPVGGWPITDFLKHHVLADKNRTKPITMSALNSGNKNNNPLKRSNSTPRRLSNSNQKESEQRSSSKLKTSIINTKIAQTTTTELDDVKDGNLKIPAESSTPSKELFTDDNELKKPSSDLKPPPPIHETTSPKPALLKSMSVEDFLNTNPDGTINYDSIVKSNLFQKKVNEYLESRVEELLKERTDAVVREISEKYDFVINKLVAAVDAEFTLLTNRIKILEAQNQN